MVSEKYLALVGVGEEDTAHLRLLLRAAANQLNFRWRWGTEDNADLIIIDPSELSGQIARNRAFSSGRRCAIFSADEPLREGEQRIAKPFKADALVALLNATTATSANAGTQVEQFTDDFYDIQFNPEFQLEDDEAADARTRKPDLNPALGLDELLRPDADAMKPQFAVPVKLAADTKITQVHTTSQRSENRTADSVRGLRAPDEKAEGINLAARFTGKSDNNEFPLRDYLRGTLLGGPATILLDGAPPLTLDPKEQQFVTPGKLRELGAYCRTPIARDAWRTLTTQELSRQRNEYGTHPYSLLIWLDVLLHSGGRLARHLDPGGRFRLKIYPKAEKDFPKHMAIVAALQQPVKLNEISANARASMEEVFDVVNAYDAIGLIEVEKRLPRHDEPEQRSGLFARLRKPFGKS